MGPRRAVDENNRIVSSLNPNAIAFTATAAIERAIYDLTGDPPEKRETLTGASFQLLLECCNNSWFDLYYKKLEKMSKRQTINFLQSQIDAWENRQ